MPMQFSGDNPERHGTSYGDFEVQTVRVNQTTGTGGGAAATSAEIEPVGPSELDNDEVAELVMMRRDLTVFITDSEDNAEESSINGQYELQVNASPGGSTNPQFVTSDEHFGVNGIGFDDDSPILDVARTIPFVPALEEGGSGFSGGGGGGGGPSNQDTLTFRQWLGQGPWLDNDDSLDIRAEIEARNYASAALVDVVLQFYWNIQTVSGARPTLSPPGGV